VQKYDFCLETAKQGHLGILNLFYKMQSGKTKQKNSGMKKHALLPLEGAIFKLYTG
jgi:hypothetical protein